MKKALVVGDSKVFALAISREIRNQLSLGCEIAASYQEAMELLNGRESEFFVAVLDLNLPDAPNGEIVDDVVACKIPAVVLTGDFSDDTRRHVLSKNVVDYILKDGPGAVEQLVQVVRRIWRHRTVKILVADDSTVSRATIRQLLETQRYSVIEATNGHDALRLIDEHPDVKLVLTDYHMPRMGGTELTALIRSRRPMHEVAIIGLSSHGGSALSAKFLKLGANDFLHKPFSSEELFWRVNQNIEMLAHITSLKRAAVEDYLTGLYNRRYFFEVGEKLFQNARRQNLHLTVAMMDLDRFKRINDRFGHGIGDQVIHQASQLLKRSFRQSDVLSRFGGEEFCVLATNMKRGEAFFHFEKFRQRLEAERIPTPKGKVAFSVSIGVTSQLGQTLESTVIRADDLLYRAKKAGRNRVVTDE